jgi:hypothetical protein
MNKTNTRMLPIGDGNANPHTEKKENTTPPRIALIGIELYLIFNSTPLIPA